MLERLTGLPEGVEGFKAVGQVSKTEYSEVFEPLVDTAEREGQRHHPQKIARIAVAVDGPLVSLATRLGEHFVKAKVQCFEYDALDAATTWAGCDSADSVTLPPRGAAASNEQGT